MGIQDCRPGLTSWATFMPSLRDSEVVSAPSFALLAKGGMPRISIPTVAYPTLCKERKGWGTRLFVVLTAVPNTSGGLIEHLFLRKPHEARSKLGYLEDVLVLRRLRERAFRNPARDLEELPGVLVPFSGQNDGQSAVAAVPDFGVQFNGA